MELAFLAGAVRRYYWIILLGVLLGALPGLILGGRGDALYESHAVLLVSPPSQSVLQVSFTGDRDRYVSGQLSVLKSRSLVDSVVESLGDVSAAQVADAVRFAREPLTDVVTVTATMSDPERAQEVAEAYVAAYFDQLQAQIDGSSEPGAVRLQEEIDAVRAEVTEIDDQMIAVMRPYLDADPIPTPDQVAPGLVSEKAILLAQYAELQRRLTELSSDLQVSSKVVQDATLPSAPVQSSSRKLVVVGAVAGGFLGLVVAAVVTRLSPTVLDDAQAEDILGHPVVGALPPFPEVSLDRHAIFQDHSPAATRFLDALCVRAEATSQGRPTLTVLVAGSERGSGTSTLAAALAQRFARSGVRVLLVDADTQHPEVDRLFAAALARDPAPVAVGGPPPLPATGSMPNLQVAGLGDLWARSASAGDERAGPRRLDVAELIAFASSDADVLVFDGGALMGAVSTVQLAWLSDAVVLTMPRHQQIRALEVVATELRDRRHVLPVWTAAGRSTADA